MKNWMLKTSLVAFAVLISQSAQAGHWYSHGYHYGPAYYSAPIRVYRAPVYPVYRPVVVPRVVYRPVYLSRPAVTYVAPAPVYSHAAFASPSYTRTSYNPHGRFARYKEKTYTPYGRHETEYRFDKKYGTWRVKHDFDD